MKALTVAGAVSLGFIAGALLGFTWGQGAKSRLSGSVETATNDGKIIVTVDAKKAALGALAEYL